MLSPTLANIQTMCPLLAWEPRLFLTTFFTPCHKWSSSVHLLQCKWTVTVIWVWLLNKAIWLHSWVITHLSSMINLSPWPSTHSPLVSMEVELILSRWGTPDWNHCPDHCFGNWQPPANTKHLLHFVFIPSTNHSLTWKAFYRQTM